MDTQTDIVLVKEDLGKNLYRSKKYYTLVIEQDVLADNKDDVQLADITSKTIEEMLDIPTLNIVQSMFYEGMSKEPNKAARIISVPAVQGVSGFVPAPIRQLSQYLDPTLRKTTAEGIFPKIGERIQSSTPIAREGLQPQVSPMGRELQATQGFASFSLCPIQPR